jgi:hypothetical protein
MFERERESLIAHQILAEVDRQHELWGTQNHPDGTMKGLDTIYAQNAKHKCEMAVKSDSLTWRDILDEEVKEVFAEYDQEKIREELLQVAAVSLSWIAAIDRRAEL